MIARPDRVLARNPRQVETRCSQREYGSDQNDEDTEDGADEPEKYPPTTRLSQAATPLVAASSEPSV
jgi:hypothetical protein